MLLTKINAAAARGVVSAHGPRALLSFAAKRTALSRRQFTAACGAAAVAVGGLAGKLHDERCGLQLPGGQRRVGDGVGDAGE